MNERTLENLLDNQGVSDTDKAIFDALDTGILPNVCPVEGCGTRWDEPVVMARHLARQHAWTPQQIAKCAASAGQEVV